MIHTRAFRSPAKELERVSRNLMIQEHTSALLHNGQHVGTVLDLLHVCVGTDPDPEQRSLQPLGGELQQCVQEVQPAILPHDLRFLYRKSTT